MPEPIQICKNSHHITNSHVTLPVSHIHTEWFGFFVYRPVALSDSLVSGLSRVFVLAAATDAIRFLVTASAFAPQWLPFVYGTPCSTVVGRSWRPSDRWTPTLLPERSGRGCGGVGLGIAVGLFVGPFLV